MSTLSRKWVPAIALAAWCCAAAAALADDDSSDADATDRATIDLEELTRRLAQWRASFHNLRIVWELRSLPKTKEAVVVWPPPPDPDTGSLFSRREWIWGEEGLQFLEERSFFYPDGGSEIHSIEAFSGPKDLIFLANFQQPPRGTEKLVKLVLDGSAGGKPPSEKMRTPLQSLYWPDRTAWLPEVLSNGDWKFEKVEDVAGEPCAKVVAAQSRSAGGAPVGELWLDLSHDCLVRRHRRPGSGTTLGDDFVVDDYQRLEGGVWLPKRGRMQFAGTPYDNQMFVVTEAEVNEPIDPARLEPPPPAVGTEVYDHGKSYTHGGTTTKGQPGTKTAGGYVTWGAFFSTITSNWRWWTAAATCIMVVLLAVGWRFLHQRTPDRP